MLRNFLCVLKLDESKDGENNHSVELYQYSDDFATSAIDTFIFIVQTSGYQGRFTVILLCLQTGGGALSVICCQCPLEEYQTGSPNFGKESTCWSAKVGRQMGLQSLRKTKKNKKFRTQQKMWVF